MRIELFWQMLLLAPLVLAVSHAASRADGGDLGFRLDRRFTPVSQGTPAGALIGLDDGGLMGLSSVDGGRVRVSEDDGRTWREVGRMYEGPGPGALTKDLECGLALRTRGGVILWVYRDFEDWVWRWDEEKNEATQARLDVWAIRSLDGGKTWVDRQRIFEGYCGSVNDIVQTSTGAVVVPVELYVPNPGRHAQCTCVSLDEGKTWHRSNILDLGGHGHHDGIMEGSVVELRDGRLYMLMRTGLDRLWEAYSWDDGLTWRELRPSGIAASSSPAYIGRLASGRLALVWNQLTPGKQPRPLSVLRADPTAPHSPSAALPADWFRDALSIALSEDEGQTWGEPIVFARGERLCYPQMHERRPGEVWISFVAGKSWTINLVAAREADLVGGEDAAGATTGVKPFTVVAFGDSTTAPRGSLVVYADLLSEELGAGGGDRPVRVVNAGLGSDTTETARARVEADVLAREPDVVIVQFGINDAAVDVWRGASEPRVARERYRENLAYLAREVKARGARVVLMTPNPLSWTDELRKLYGKPPYEPEAPDGLNVVLRDYAACAREVAEAEGVALVDVYRAFEEHGAAEGRSVGELLLDGMHPNAAGHELVARLLVGELEGLGPPGHER